MFCRELSKNDKLQFGVVVYGKGIKYEYNIDFTSDITTITKDVLEIPFNSEEEKGISKITDQLVQLLTYCTSSRSRIKYKKHNVILQKFGDC